MKIATLQTADIGLSNGLFLFQNNGVVVLDIIPERIEMLNNKKIPIKDKVYTKDIFRNKGE
ncbi:hypothetical protein [Aliarcobacter butzleri]|uniref:hypothetical protein n=1 Tax=Aliarcobacter butzleri TaxID=28197 RepID=UPI00191AE989|nr:hypothetical protein [Aliarcobacter butzleri]